MASVSVADMRAHIAFLRDVHVHSIRDESSSLYFDHPPREPPPVQGFLRLRRASFGGELEVDEPLALAIDVHVRNFAVFAALLLDILRDS